MIVITSVVEIVSWCVRKWRHKQKLMLLIRWHWSNLRSKTIQVHVATCITCERWLIAILLLFSDALLSTSSLFESPSHHNFVSCLHIIVSFLCDPFWNSSCHVCYIIDFLSSIVSVVSAFFSTHTTRNIYKITGGTFRIQFAVLKVACRTLLKQVFLSRAGMSMKLPVIRSFP